MDDFFCFASMTKWATCITKNYPGILCSPSSSLLLLSGWHRYAPQSPLVPSTGFPIIKTSERLSRRARLYVCLPHATSNVVHCCLVVGPSSTWDAWLRIIDFWFPRILGIITIPASLRCQMHNAAHWRYPWLYGVAACTRLSLLIDRTNPPK